MDDTACYAVKKDGTLWKWGDGAPVEAYWDGEKFTDVREPEDQTGWPPRQVEYPGYWDEILTNFGGSLRLRFYADGSLVLAQELNIVTFLYRALGIGNDGWGAVGAAWVEREGLLADTGVTVDPGISCPRSAVVTFLYRELG